MEAGISKVELQFTDLLHLRSIEINSKSYYECKKYGKGIDGSSILLANIEKSDLLLKPIEGTFFRLPWDLKVGRVLCDIFEPSEKAENFLKEKEYELSPRYILKKALEKVKEIGYNFFVGSEMEFFILREEKSIDNSWYLSPSPLDKGVSIRREIFDTLEIAKIRGEYLHHEVSSGQYEICLKYEDALKAADDVVTFKYIAKNIASQKGLLLTFMPKPFVGMNGSGMHVHMSLFDKNGNIFFGKERISEEAKHFIAGLLKHAKALAAIAAPTVNSYKRLVPGYEAPVNISWGFMNRSTLIRIPAFNNKDSARIELRMPDATCNPYLLFACVLSAGVEGMEERLEPCEPCEINTYHAEGFERIPENLEAALREMEKDKLISKTLGKAFDLFLKIKRKEWEEYKKVQKEWDPLKITEWEKERYLDFI